MASIRVLHIFGQMNRGGAELRTLDVMRQLDSSSVQMDYCALSGNVGTLDDEIRALGGQVHLLPLRNGFGRSFRQLLQDQRYDVVHSHIHEASGYILRLAYQAGIKTRVAHFRSTTDGKPPSLFRRIKRLAFRHWIHRYATHILGVSRTTLSTAWTPNWERDSRCQAVYNGIGTFALSLNEQRDEIRRELNIPRNDFTVIHVGNVRPPKNHLKVLSVFREFHGRHPATRLLLVGDYDSVYGREIQQQTQALDLGEKVSFLGMRTDVSRLLAAADVLLFPSFYEGLPGAVLEACAAGLPVVGSNLPVHREISTYLSGVQLMDIDASDARWCEALQRVESLARTAGQRQALQHEFRTSPFQVEATATALTRIWNDEKGRAAAGQRRKAA